MKNLWRFVKQLLAKLMLALIAFYRTCISPLTPPACRYTPTCSQYAQEAIRKYLARPKAHPPLPPLRRLGLRPRALKKYHIFFAR